MRRASIIFTVIFCVLLLLPAGWETLHCLRSGERFQPVDLLSDTFVRPYARERALACVSDSALREWNSVKRRGAYDEDSLDSLFNLLASLKDSVTAVNSYAPLDTADLELAPFAALDSALWSLSEDSSLVPRADSLVKSVTSRYGHFSALRVVQMYRKHGFWTSRYLRAYEHRLENENAMVVTLRPRYQALLWNVFRDPGEKGVRGDSDWLFYREDVNYLVRPSPFDRRSDSLDNPVTAILDFKRQLDARGIRLLVVLMPGKPSVYPEKLNEDAAPHTGRDFSHSMTVLDSLSAHGVDYVNLFETFTQAKRQDSRGNYLYLDKDTHWTPRGAELAAQVIAKRVSEYDFAKVLPVKEYADSAVKVERTGDIATMSGLDVFKTQIVTAHKVRETSGAPFKDDFRASQILILGDSYSRIYETDSPMDAGWIAHFAKDMHTPVASIVSDGGASTLVREKLARKSRVLRNKKLVIWEFVERDLRYGDSGWKKIEMEK